MSQCDGFATSVCPIGIPSGNVPIGHPRYGFPLRSRGNDVAPQEDDRIGRERVFRADGAEGTAQDIDGVGRREDRSAIARHDGEEPGTTGDEGAAVLHGGGCAAGGVGLRSCAANPTYADWSEPAHEKVDKKQWMHEVPSSAQSRASTTGFVGRISAA